MTGTAQSAPKKTMILVVAFNAEKTIASVLSRIPAERLPEETEVVVMDDASADRTFEATLGERERLPHLRITVLSNPVNRGYGGNQKIGFEYAVQNGFSVVALLHGDGRYAADKLPELLAPVLRGEADACLGSRMMEPGAARRDGMPLYKYLGNRILTQFQNRALGMALSEFHSGYRAYLVEALRQVPFRWGADDFHFDTEILIQFRLRGLRISEVPIPVYSGDEIGPLIGLRYAWHVVLATLASRIHGMGLLYQPKFDVEGPAPHYGLKLGYASSHAYAIAAVRDESRVLDIACGAGGVAAELAKRGCRVTGIDQGAPRENAFERVFVHDLDNGTLPDGLGTYDYILALDCLEHLRRPEVLLEELRERCYAGNTTLIVTAPNIGFVVTRIGLMLGQFNYGSLGILDLTHKRLFTFGSLRRLLAQQEYEIVAMRGIPAPFPKALRTRWLAHLLLNLNLLLIGLCRRLFAYQIYVEARFRPPLSRLLARTVECTGRRSESFGGSRGRSPPGAG